MAIIKRPIQRREKREWGCYCESRVSYRPTKSSGRPVVLVKKSNEKYVPETKITLNTPLLLLSIKFQVDGREESVSARRGGGVNLTEESIFVPYDGLFLLRCCVSLHLSCCLSSSGEFVMIRGPSVWKTTLVLFVLFSLGVFWWLIQFSVKYTRHDWRTPPRALSVYYLCTVCWSTHNII